MTGENRAGEERKVILGHMDQACTKSPITWRCLPPKIGAFLC